MAGHDADILRQHLQLVPASGDIALLLALPQTCIDRLGGVRTSLEKRVGYRLTSEDTLSLLLFDYVVEQKRSEEHTSELQSLMRISYAVFCLKKKQNKQTQHT